MTVKVLMFASLAQELGVRELDLELADNATVGQALDLLVERYPALGQMRHRMATAVQMAYVKDDHELSPGDQLALIPPVSGG